MWCWAAAAVAIGLSASPAAAQILLRSDLPLWTDRSAEGFWPRSFSDQESFGCESRLRFGDFVVSELQPALEPTSGDPREILRIANYGYVHCAYIVRRDFEDEIATADGKYAWAIELGIEPVGRDRLEMMALQIGAAGGSEYIVVAQAEGADWTDLRILDLHCPEGALRDAGRIDLWSTAYCGVESKAQLETMARQAAHRPPFARAALLTPP